VKSEDRESVIPRVWETPFAEQIKVSAEASAYMGAWTDEDLM